MPKDVTDDKIILVLVMAWCHQAETITSGNTDPDLCDHVANELSCEIIPQGTPAHVESSTTHMFYKHILGLAHPSVSYFSHQTVAAMLRTLCFMSQTTNLLFIKFSISSASFGQFS